MNSLLLLIIGFCKLSTIVTLLPTHLVGRTLFTHPLAPLLKTFRHCKCLEHQIQQFFKFNCHKPVVQHKVTTTINGQDWSSSAFRLLDLELVVLPFGLISSSSIPGAYPVIMQDDRESCRREEEEERAEQRAKLFLPVGEKVGGFVINEEDVQGSQLVEEIESLCMNCEENVRRYPHSAGDYRH